MTEGRRPRARTKAKRATPPALRPVAAAEASKPRSDLSLISMARQVRSWADTVLGMAGNAADMSLALAKSSVKGPRKKAAIEKAGSMLRQLRQTAGLTAQEVGKAIDLNDAELIEQAERGKIALPFEVILRLASVLGRRDPITFVMRLTRSYYPDLWTALDDLGVGRLVVQAGRERELANLYRANDAARSLTDAQFSAVLAFVKAAFDMAVDFRNQTQKK
jgi:transcriptional regulator with XRE-family HTH domain